MDQDVHISEDPPGNTADLCVKLVDDDNPGAGLRAPLTVFLNFSQFGDQPLASKLVLLQKSIITPKYIYDSH